MLKKIAICTFAEGFLLTVLVGQVVPGVKSALTLIKIPVDLFSVRIPILYVVPGFIFALLARGFRLHDLLSKLFRIRERFDVSKILVPLAAAVGSTISVSNLKKNRRIAMNRTFYAYASFEEPKISKALVLSSIDTWTWYWIILELGFLLALTAVTLICFRAFRPATFVAGGFALSILILLAVFPVCAKKAAYQIEEIISDDTRTVAIRDQFSLLGAGHKKAR